MSAIRAPASLFGPELQVDVEAALGAVPMQQNNSWSW
jgi:hypothetical protein